MDTIKEVKEHIEKFGFYIGFCPVCGSDDITYWSGFDTLFKTNRIDLGCRNCHWKMAILITRKGKKNFKLRQDEDIIRI